MLTPSLVQRLTTYLSAYKPCRRAPITSIGGITGISSLPFGLSTTQLRLYVHDPPYAALQLQERFPDETCDPRLRAPVHQQMEQQ